MTFRFCKVADAVAFNGVVRRDEEFEQCSKLRGLLERKFVLTALELDTMYSTDP